MRLAAGRPRKHAPRPCPAGTSKPIQNHFDHEGKGLIAVFSEKRPVLSETCFADDFSLLPLFVYQVPLLLAGPLRYPTCRIHTDKHLTTCMQLNFGPHIGCKYDVSSSFPLNTCVCCPNTCPSEADLNTLNTYSACRMRTRSSAVRAGGGGSAYVRL